MLTPVVGAMRSRGILGVKARFSGLVGLVSLDMGAGLFGVMDCQGS